MSRGGSRKDGSHTRSRPQLSLDESKKSTGALHKNGKSRRSKKVVKVREQEENDEDRDEDKDKVKDKDKEKLKGKGKIKEKVKYDVKGPDPDKHNDDKETPIPSSIFLSANDPPPTPSSSARLDNVLLQKIQIQTKNIHRSAWKKPKISSKDNLDQREDPPEDTRTVVFRDLAVRKSSTKKIIDHKQSQYHVGGRAKEGQSRVKFTISKHPLSTPQENRPVNTAISKHFRSTASFIPMRQRIEKAIRGGQLFELRGWSNIEVHEALLKRGWVEKPWTAHEQPSTTSTVLSRSRSRKSGISSATLSSGRLSRKRPAKSRARIHESSSISQSVNDHPANLIWVDCNHRIVWSEIAPWQKINRHPQAEYLNKKNLVEPIQNLQWIGTEPLTCINVFPRTYRLFVKEERRAFLQDYRLTACMALLKWFVRAHENCIETTSKVFGHPSSSRIKKKENHALLIEFALVQVSHYLRVRRHEDLDDSDGDSDIEFEDETPQMGDEKEGDITEVDVEMDKDTNGKIKSKTKEDNEQIETTWRIFLTGFYEMTHHRTKFHCSPLANLTPEDRQKYVEGAKELLLEVQQFWPQYDLDGMRNVWIVKPGNGTLGHGIVVMDKYEDILKKFLSRKHVEKTSPPHETGSGHRKSKTSMKRIPWLAQKYIERPLLIYKAKFDIRQWFLVSSWSPMIVWIYKKSYLRFSTKMFSLDDLHESIHLTNNSIQTRYDVDPARGFALPSENMWTSDVFQSYLRSIGKPNVWDDIIYKGMQQAILAILHATRDSIDHRPGSFHILGADFMVTDDYRPWLIEINSTPTFSHSTSVTAQLCPLCIQDTLKVILDWDPEKNPTAKTGHFELLCNVENPPSTPRGKLFNVAEVMCIKGCPAPPSWTQMPTIYKTPGTTSKLKSHAISKKKKVDKRKCTQGSSTYDFPLSQSKSQSQNTEDDDPDQTSNEKDEKNFVPSLNDKTSTPDFNALLSAFVSSIINSDSVNKNLGSSSVLSSLSKHLQSQHSTKKF